MKHILFQITSFHQFLVAVSYLSVDNIIDVILTNFAFGKGFIFFYNKVKESKLFENVYYYDELEYMPPSRKNIIKSVYYNCYGSKKHIKETLGIDLKTYDDIYVFDDYHTVGAWLVNEKISYHLLEDTANSFPETESWRKDYHFEPEKYLWMRIAIALHIAHKICGNADCCIDIEVSSTENLPPIPKSKIKIVNRKEKIKNISSEYYDTIFKIFDLDPNMFRNTYDAVLILTEPLYTDHRVNSENDQILVYQQLVNDYLGSYVLIKPHPRDRVSYNSITNAVVLNGCFPIEILQFMNSMSIGIAVAFTSTAVNAIDFANKKILLGSDRINYYLKNNMTELS